MKQQPRGRTRRPDARKPGERSTLSMRITSDLWHRLDQAARASGRSLSAEAEFRLERSFQEQDLLDQVLTLAYGQQLGAVLMAVGTVMKVVGGGAALQSTLSIEAVERWLDNPYAFAQALQAAVHVIGAMAPPGEVELNAHGRSPEFVRQSERYGERMAEQLLRAIKHPTDGDFEPAVSGRKLNAFLGRLTDQIALRDTAPHELTGTDQ
jgi:hypothetical protein